MDDQVLALAEDILRDQGREGDLLDGMDALSGAYFAFNLLETLDRLRTNGWEFRRGE